mgnify:CR=1 FL=1
MKILVTGAHGFVGTRLMKELEGAIAAPSIQRTDQADCGGERSRCDHPHSCNFGCGDL